MAATTGQTINDRLNAVRYALAGQGLARTVCKATTEEVVAPKKKHIDYLLACTDEPNVSIPQLANLLIDRTQNTSWTVVFKALISIHHLLNFGNERFTQYLATSSHSFELNDFMDRTTPQGYGMSTFVRRYAKYINDKILAYKTLAIDLCKIKPGKDNALRTMNMENLSKTLPVVHAQFDALLEFGVEQKDLNNGVIMAAFKLLYKDLNRIFAAYQEAIINLVERYFKLSRKKTREALAMYKKYLDRMDKVAQFFKIVEQVGLDKNEMPDTSKLSSLLAVLEEHYAQLEAKKRGTTPASPDGGDGDDPEVESVSPQAERAIAASSSSSQAVDEAAAATAAPAAKPTQEPPTPPGDSDQPKKATPPVRPSPKVSPKVSPSEPKPAPSVVVAEKKAPPPERPAKPPSRPPPPAATPTKSAPKPAAAAAPGEVEAKQQAAAATTSASPTPPSRPPPAHPQPPPQPKGPSQAAASLPAAGVEQASPRAADEPATTVTAPPVDGSSSQDAQVAVVVDDNNNNNHDEEDRDSGHNGNEAVDANESGPSLSQDGTGQQQQQPTCSTTLSETAASGQEVATTEEVADAQQADITAGTNHVPVNNGVHPEDEQPLPPPPPPPPVEDEGVDPGQPEDEDVEDGENGNENNHNAGAAAAVEANGGDMPAPPPPPPVEEDAA